MPNGEKPYVARRWKKLKSVLHGNRIHRRVFYDAGEKTDVIATARSYFHEKIECSEGLFIII